MWGVLLGAVIALAGVAFGVALARTSTKLEDDFDEDQA